MQEDKPLTEIELMQLQIKGLEIKCDLLRDHQARILQMIEDDKIAQNKLNGHTTECIENYGKELDLILQRIVLLWETVMKPKPT